MINDIRINKSTKTSSKRRIEASDYVERAKLLEEQDKFARNNLVNNLLVEFIIFDKGYRCIAAALLTMDMIARSTRVRKRNNNACYRNSLLDGSNFFLCRTCHNSVESLQLTY
jgi:hypothetical protein